MLKEVYHGSPQGNLTTIKSHTSTHQKECIYATDSKTVALLFMGKGKGDLDTCIASNDGHLELVERRAGILKKLYDKEGYLYILDGSTFSHYDYLWSKEVISFQKEIEPIKKVYIPNILEALIEEEKCGNLTIFRYPDRPNNIPKDNSDLIDKFVKFELQGLNGALVDLIDTYPEFENAARERLNEKRGEEKSNLKL